MRRGTQEPAQYVPRAIAPLPVASWDQTYSTEASQACAGLVILGDDFAGYCFAYDLAGQRYGEVSPVGEWQPWVLEAGITDYTNENPKPTEMQVMSFAKGFGSYIGEVYRRNHGATWGISSVGGQQTVGLSTRGGVQFWPWARAFKRITLGPEENVSHYYSILLEGSLK